MDARLVEARDDWLGGGAAHRAAQGPELIARCGRAVRGLVDRLRSIGAPLPTPITACPDLDLAIAALEAVGPPVPLALRSFWEQVGAVSLLDQEGYAHVAYWYGRGARTHQVTDPVAVDGPGIDGWLEYAVDDLEVQAEEGWPAGWMLSADGYHKDDISGGGPHLLVPDVDPWLPRLEEFRWWGPSRPSSAPPGDAPDLVSYLRSSILEAAGYPGLLGDPAFEPVRQELVEGLPIF